VDYQDAGWDYSGPQPQKGQLPLSRKQVAEHYHPHSPFKLAGQEQEKWQTDVLAIGKTGFPAGGAPRHAPCELKVGTKELAAQTA
jgi:hypothetical protein